MNEECIRNVRQKRKKRENENESKRKRRTTPSFILEKRKNRGNDPVKT